MVEPLSPATLIDWALPLVRQAGRYAIRIQKRIGIQPAKDQYSSSFAQALTDADLSIQTRMEIALLADYPHIGFFGEEEDKSYNAKYFDNISPYWVLLDPIDGTRFYMDGHANFNIILSILGPEGFEGAIVALPGLNQIFTADRERGAQVFLGNSSSQTLRLDQVEPVIITYQGSEIREWVEPEFKVVDISQDYSAETGCLGVSAVLMGQACGIYGKTCALIDWGAIGYIVEQAGGQLSDRTGASISLAGVEPRYRYPTLIAATDPQIHQRIIQRLNS